MVTLITANWLTVAQPLPLLLDAYRDGTPIIAADTEASIGNRDHPAALAYWSQWLASELLH